MITPLLVTDSLFFPFITGKNFFFRIVVEVILGSWVILALLDRRYRPAPLFRFRRDSTGPKRNWLFIAIAGFVGIMALADIFGENPLKSFASNYERMMGWIILAHLFIYFIILGTVLNTEKLWRWFLNSTVGVSLIISGYSILQMLGYLTIHQGGARVDATLGNATYLAAYMLFSIFITLFLLVHYYRGAWARVLYGVIIALQVFVLLNTATRGAILGVMGGVFLIALLLALYEKKRPALRKIAIGFILFLLVFGGASYLARNTSVVENTPGLNRVTSITLDQKTVRSRFMVWGMSLKGFEERPLLGWGQENFNYVFNKYYNPRMYNQEPWFDRAHNAVFDWLIAGGILGLLGYLSIFVLALYYIWSRRSDFEFLERVIFTGLIAAYGFHNLFVFDNITSYLLFFVVLALIYHRSTRGACEEFYPRAREAGISKNYAKSIALPVCIILVPTIVWAVNVPSIVRARTLIIAMSPNTNSIKQNLYYFEKALNSNAPIGGQEVRERMAEVAASRVAQNKKIPKEPKQAFFNTAEKAMQNQMERSPNDAREWLFLGSLYNNFGKVDKALEAFKKAHKYSPNKQSIMTQIGLVYISQGKNEKGLKWLRKSYMTLPKNDNALISYAIGAVYAGRNDLANELLKWRFGTTTVINNDRLLGAYANTGQNDKVLAIWNKRVKEDPENAQKRVSLAAAYHRAGKTQKAIEQLRKAGELNPKAKPQMKKFIEKIKKRARKVQQ